MASRKRSASNDADFSALQKEWDEASCPICMDHPHNAVLLLCSSHENGCRSYICDTSYRHSNCLDRYKKLSDNETPSLPGISPTNQDTSISIPGSDLVWRTTSELTGAHENQDLVESNSISSVELPQGPGESTINLSGGRFETQGDVQETADSESLERVETEDTAAQHPSGSRLRCPLCRGNVLGWKVIEEARDYLNLKSRSCSRESCSFSGSYGELRRHARRVHPTARPSDIDPSRERTWRRLEHQREYGDIVSAIRSAMPGAVVLGDYVIDHGERLSGERERGSGDVGGPWWTTFFLFQMIGSMDRDAERRASRSRALTRHRRSTGASSARRYLWGENLLGLQYEDDEDEENAPEMNILSDVDEVASPNPRRRRRLTRYRSDEDQS